MGKPVVCPQGGARAQQLIIGDDETEFDLSLGSRSFLDRVNVQVQKRQKRSSMNVTEDGEKHSVLWGMFMSSTLEASVFMGKNCSGNWQSIKNIQDLTMFDISAKWENSSWKCLSLIGDEQVISLQRTKVDVFSDSALCFGKIHETPNQTLHGNKDWNVSKHLRNTETLTESTASQWNSSGIFPKDSAQSRSQTFTVETGCHGDQETLKKNASQMPDSFPNLQEDLEQENGHSSVLVQKSGILSVQIVHKVNGTEWQRR